LKFEELRERFSRELNRTPSNNNQWHVSVKESDDVFLFKVITESDLLNYQLTEITFFPYRNDVIDHAGKQLFNSIDAGYELAVPKSDLLEEPIDRLEGLLVSKEGWAGKGLMHSLSVKVPIN